MPPGDGSADDPLYTQAVDLVRTQERASVSLVQRHLLLGYNRAARLIEAMEAKGVVSVAASNGDRTVLAASGVAA
ncbi:DNA translocase FtsK [Janthinobacterium sp. S3M3]|uniref:DNA translocase FtsK n=1 Tax=Janthinobacterium sp. S3M3 TaxID=2723078 RepID=UPI00288AE027|nr:DNA translocase FtsK [Janthinobacterium sp. S3M3]